MTFAYITTDADGRLADDSTCTIGDTTIPVPPRVDPGGRVAPMRIAHTLVSLGYRPATNYYNDISRADNGIYVAVIPYITDQCADAQCGNCWDDNCTCPCHD